MPYEDGTYSAAKPLGPKRISYPFLQNGDKFAKKIERDYAIASASYVPTMASRQSRTNILTYSNVFENAAWTKTNGTVADNNLTNPWNGGSTAAKFLETAANGEHNLRHAATFTAAQHTLSAIVRGGLTRTSVLLYANDLTTAFSAVFNITTGASSGASNCTAASVALDDGYYLISITFTPLAATGVADLYAYNGSTIYAGDTSMGFYVAQMQLEVGSTFGSLITTAGASVTVSAPPTDYGQNSATDALADPFAYLCAEVPEAAFQGAYQKITRTYARLPVAQTTYGSTLFVWPDINDVTTSNYFAVSFDDGDTAHVFSSRKAVASIGAPEATYFNPTNARGPLGHYQVTVELDNSSQSFYLDDSDTTIKNALSTAFSGGTGNAGNFYISRWIYGLYISWAGITAKVKAITVTDVEIEVSDRTIALGTGSSTGPIEFVSAQTVLTSTRTVTSANHGASAGNRVVLYNGNRVIARSTVISADTNTYQFSADDLPGADEVVTNCAFDKDGTRYVTRPIPVSTKITENYYLPGISTNINTPVDITLTAPEVDAVSWLGKIATSANYAVVNGSELSQWIGPIWRVVKTEVDVNDALKSVSANA